jgi:trans-2,3-dihydro-3-hydroxyanthranilate isomerase
MAAYLVNYGLLRPVNGVAEWLHEQGHFMNRPGHVHVTVYGKAGAVEKVQVAGSSVYMGHGEMHLPDKVLE